MDHELRNATIEECAVICDRMAESCASNAKWSAENGEREMLIEKLCAQERAHMFAAIRMRALKVIVLQAAG